ncbi:MAG: hypothetical protein JXA94_06540, partial [Parachlamydiales bacterium]|nr:hypothetical protein [Parachlamydiales bacterium]
MKKIFYFLVFLVSFCLHAKESYYILIEPKFSGFSGSEDILTFHQGLEEARNKLLKIPKEKRVLYAFARFSELFLIWAPLSETEIVIQHEVFGHGYRIRDFGSHFAKVKKYKINTPSPYGSGGGATYYTFGENYTSFQETATSIAGVEATATLANRLKMKWLQSLRLDPLKAFLYLQAQQDLTSYIYTLNDSPIFSNEGHDIESFLFWLNNTYYNDLLKKQTLKKSALISLVDPYTYYSILSVFYYIFSGKDFKIPMINFKNIKYLPSLRLGLAPFGLEYYLENFFSYENRAIYSYLKIGKHNNKVFWGMGFDFPQIYKTKKTALGFRLDSFLQPKIYYKSAMFTFENVQIGYDEKDLKKFTFGSSLLLTLEQKLSKKFSFYTQAGYKTKGFIQSFPLREDIVFRVGFGLNNF